MTGASLAPEIATALAEHDAGIAALGLEIWIGAEPTFTDRFSAAPEWIGQAIGADKEARARRLASRLASAAPGGALLRTLGRCYPGEAQPRFSYGLLARRDGAPVWEGPPDPLCGGLPSEPAAVERFATGLAAELTAAGLQGLVSLGSSPGEDQVCLRLDGPSLPVGPDDSGLAQPPLYSAQPSPAGGGSADGVCVLVATLVRDAGLLYAALELPRLGSDSYLRLLELAARAAVGAGLGGLILRGAPPPPDPRLAWSTLTPDPGVVEINQAPATSVSELWQTNLGLFAAAGEEGLAPLQLHYNGQVDDSGGGGQLSIGGPTPDRSPFRVEPRLLPRLVRYLNRHPSLSYWFATYYIGACSQAPRPDEGVSDLFDELGLALDQLAERAAPDPGFVWRSLSPFLRDVTGNSHRSELNIEKLWSPWPRPDGIDGVVEFRAFRMAPTPEDLAALGALVRALVAMLMVRPYEEPLIRWGERLHDRFALPFFLRQDLDEVLSDLASSGLGLSPVLTERLRQDPGRKIAAVDCGGAQFSVCAALEFWPQVGDSLNQPADSRLVDASTARLQLKLNAESDSELAAWRLSVNDFAVPLRPVADCEPPTALIGVRYRRFSPGPLGLHPGIEPVLPLRLRLYHRDGRMLEADYHEWRPEGGPYPGLPVDVEEAARRRADRLVTRLYEASAVPAVLAPRPSALSEYGFDLRRA